MLGSEYRPIYHLHVRKTAGTTINFAFLSNTGLPDVESFYERLAAKENHRLIANNHVFVGWNKPLINEGCFSYAFSHHPMHQLDFKQKPFLFTCLRDPVKRVISLYNMMKLYQIEGVDHPAVYKDGDWLGSSFDDFLTRIPKDHLLNQLYMFSENFDPNEAYDNLMALDKILFTEDLADGLRDLEGIVDWKLPISNQKTYSYKSEIGPSEIAKLKERLIPEYKLLEKINARYSL